MKKPVTISIDEKLDKQIRTLQASLIAKSGSSWSYSKVLHLLVEEGLKHASKKKSSISA